LVAVFSVFAVGEDTSRFAKSAEVSVDFAFRFDFGLADCSGAGVGVSISETGAGRRSGVMKRSTIEIAAQNGVLNFTI